MHDMRKFAFLISALVLVASKLTAEELKEQSFTNENIGRVVLKAPKDWKPIERHHINFGTTFYRLVPPKSEFDLEILVNDLKHMSMAALVDKDLEKYIESNMAESASQSVEGKVRGRRFGEHKDGVFARVTDKAPKPGEYLYFTQGVRLIGTNVVLFTLLSNDKDEAALKATLAIVESVKLEAKPK